MTKLAELVKKLFKSRLRKRIELRRNDLIRELTRAKTDPILAGIKQSRKLHHIRMQITLITELLD